ncbi:MAG: glycosyltransferase [Brevundimonas sp.]|nr:MAG: glycosyltransferase [Brevundimonas sp.]
MSDIAVVIPTLRRPDSLSRALRSLTTQTLVAATDAPLIAFLDDDEVASPGWLQALSSTQTATGADAVFGPIQGRAPDASAWLKPYLERFFGRSGPADSGPLDHAFGCGNSLLVRATALPGAAPFDPAADQIGGEDDVLFAGLRQRGGRFAWAAEASVEEFAPAHRATLSYTLARTPCTAS